MSEQYNNPTTYQNTPEEEQPHSAAPETDVNPGKVDIVTSAKESLTGLSGLKFKLHRKLVGAFNALTRFNAEHRGSYQEHRVAVMERGLAAMKRKLDRKEQRIHTSAEKAPHDIVRERRLKRLDDLQPLRDAIAKRNDKIFKRKARLADRRGDAASLTDHRTKQLEKHATSALNRQAEKTGLRELRGEMKGLGYNRAERKLVMERLRGHRGEILKTLGGLAISRDQLARQEDGVKSQLHESEASIAAAEAHLEDLRRRSDSNANEITETENALMEARQDYEALKTIIDWQNPPLENGNEVLSEEPIGDTTILDDVLNRHTAEQRLEEIAALEQQLKEQVLLQERLDKDMEEAAQKIEDAEANFLATKTRLESKIKDLSKMRKAVNERIELIKQKIYRNK